MFYRLNDDVSFCDAGGRFVFLDVAHDRYFRLADPVDLGLRDLMSRGADPTAYLRHAMCASDCTEAPLQYGVIHLDTIKARRSALEGHLTGGMNLPRATPSIAYRILLTRWWLRTHPLKSLLLDVAAYRERRAVERDNRETDRGIQHAALSFKRARLKVPVETSCLLDSIALVMQLASQGFHSKIVFGVTAEPFCAHCWVQAGDLVLNDTVGNAIAHTPIRVV